MTGFKLRHVPTGTLLQFPFVSATAAVIFAETEAPHSGDEYRPEPVALPCDCAAPFVAADRAGAYRCAHCGAVAQ